MFVLPGQVEPQTRIPIAAELGVDHFLGIQHVAANALSYIVLVHIAGRIALLEELAHLLLRPDVVQHANAHHSHKAIAFAQVPLAAEPYAKAQHFARGLIIHQDQFPRKHIGEHVLPQPLHAVARKDARLHVVIAKAVACTTTIDDVLGQQDDLVAGLGANLAQLFNLAAGAL